jgi:hypothetical protein
LRSAEHLGIHLLLALGLSVQVFLDLGQLGLDLGRVGVDRRCSDEILGSVVSEGKEKAEKKKKRTFLAASQFLRLM